MPSIIPAPKVSIFGDCRPRDLNLRQGFFNPAVAVKLETQIFPPFRSMLGGAVLLFVRDTVIGTGWGQEVEAAFISRLALPLVWTSR